MSLHPCHISHKIGSCHNGAGNASLASRMTQVVISYESHQSINNHWKPSFTCIMRMNAFILHSISCHSIVFYYLIYHIYSTITTHSSIIIDNYNQYKLLRVGCALIIILMKVNKLYGDCLMMLLLFMIVVFDWQWNSNTYSKILHKN